MCVTLDRTIGLSLRNRCLASALLDLHPLELVLLTLSSISEYTLSLGICLLIGTVSAKVSWTLIVTPLVVPWARPQQLAPLSATRRKDLLTLHAIREE